MVVIVNVFWMFIGKFGGLFVDMFSEELVFFVMKNNLFLVGYILEIVDEIIVG